MLLKCLFFFFLFTTFLFSKNIIVSIESVEKFFDNNFSKEACESSLKLVEEDATNFNLQLHIGQCALNRGDIDAAMAAFDRADILKENNVLVYKCLGDMHSKIGNFKLARSAYDKADMLCETPVDRIPVVNKKPHKFNFQLHLFRGYDDNVELLGNISEINNQLGTTLNTGDVLSDWFTKEYFFLEYLYKEDMSRFYYYKSTLEILNRHHDTYAQDDFLYQFIRTGPAWGNKTFDIWIPFGYTKGTIGHEAYTESFSLNPQFMKTMADSLILMFELSYEHVKSLRVELDSYSLSRGSLFLNKHFEKQIIRAGYSYLFANDISSESKERFINNFYHEYNLAYIWNINIDFTLNLEFIYRRTSYDDFLSDTSDEKRFDALSQYRTSFTYRMNDTIYLITEYIRYNNRTNYKLYDYTQNIISFGVSSYF